MIAARAHELADARARKSASSCRENPIGAEAIEGGLGGEPEGAPLEEALGNALLMDDLQAMLAGNLAPTTAFMSGKLRVEGDMRVAMMLQSLI